MGDEIKITISLSKEEIIEALKEACKEINEELNKLIDKYKNDEI